MAGRVGREEPEIVVDFGKPVNFDKLVLQENIATGQQIESFKIYCEKNGRWKNFVKARL